MKRLDLHPEASLEVADALRYYIGSAADGVADDLHDRINIALDTISAHPERYPFWQRTRFRRCVPGRFPYVIFYDDEPKRVHVLAIAHTSRRPGYWKTRIAVD